MIKKLFRAGIRKVIPSKAYVMYEGSILPASDMRWCGPEFKDNSFYLQSAEAEAQRLITNFRCDRNSKILDIGCGHGRLPIGILRVIGELAYIGFDVDKGSIQWCKGYIESRHPCFRFHHLNISNERYNTRGKPLNDEFKFELADKSIDIIYLFSVFSHMREEDMRVYLSEFTRILGDGGKVFFTTFVEEDVPNISINPSNYVFGKCTGPLHIVRYEKSYLFSILDEIGFIVDNFTYGTEANSQSAIYLSKTNSG